MTHTADRRAALAMLEESTEIEAVQRVHATRAGNDCADLQECVKLVMIETSGSRRDKTNWLLMINLFPLCNGSVRSLRVSCESPASKGE